MSEIGKRILSFINSGSKKTTGKRNIVPFDEARSIGVLYSWEGTKKEEAIEKFKAELSEAKSISCVCYSPDKKVVPETKNPILSVVDLSVLGKINSTVAESFVKKPFDFLFHFDFETSEITESLLINSTAKCRVGLHSDKNEKLYELMIGINKNAGIDNLIEQMLKYVKALK